MYGHGRVEGEETSSLKMPSPLWELVTGMPAVSRNADFN